MIREFSLKLRNFVRKLFMSGNGLAKLDESPKDIGALMKEIHKDLLAEEEDKIKDVLFKWAWPKIARGVAAGVPQWYKEKLAAKQFEGGE